MATANAFGGEGSHGLTRLCHLSQFQGNFQRILDPVGSYSRGIPRNGRPIRDRAIKISLRLTGKASGNEWPSTDEVGCTSGWGAKQVLPFRCLKGWSQDAGCRPALFPPPGSSIGMRNDRVWIESIRSTWADARPPFCEQVLLDRAKT